MTDEDIERLMAEAVSVIAAGYATVPTSAEDLTFLIDEVRRLREDGEIEALSHRKTLAERNTAWIELQEVKRERDALCAEVERLLVQLRADCTCGSGAHPRHCERHPGRYKAHCREMNELSRLEHQSEELLAERDEARRIARELRGKILEHGFETMVDAVSDADWLVKP